MEPTPLRTADDLVATDPVMSAGKACTFDPTPGLSLRAPVDPDDVGDFVFPTDNDLGIPLLDLSMQAEYLSAPVAAWGSLKRNQVNQAIGTYHFYVEDYRFEGIYAEPGKLVNSNCIAAAEPNFSTSDIMPPAVAYFQIFRKRWISRYWQTRGVRIWVDLNVSTRYAEENLFGVPDGWNCYFTRGYVDRLDDLRVEHCLAQERSMRNDPFLCVYGGGMEIQEWTLKTPGAIHVPERAAIHKERTKWLKVQAQQDDPLQ